MAKLFVHDFHGTLEQGNEKALCKLVNLALGYCGFGERFTQEEINKIYGIPVIDYFKHILPDMHKIVYQNLRKSFRDIAIGKKPPIFLEYIKPSRNSHEVLETIAKKGHTQIVISNVNSDGLITFLKSVEMLDYFPEEFRFGIDNGELDKISKSDVLKKFLENRRFDNIICVGDSPQDLNLVEGCVSYLYAHDYMPVKEARCDYIIRDLRDILKEIN